MALPFPIDFYPPFWVLFSVFFFLSKVCIWKFINSFPPFRLICAEKIPRGSVTSACPCRLSRQFSISRKSAETVDRPGMRFVECSLFFSFRCWSDWLESDAIKEDDRRDRGVYIFVVICRASEADGFEPLVVRVGRYEFSSEEISLDEGRKEGRKEMDGKNRLRK